MVYNVVKSWWVCAAVCVLPYVGACGDDRTPGGQQKSPLSEDAGDVLEEDPSAITDEGLSPPTLNSIPERYGHTTIPVSGTAQPGVVVWIEGGRSTRAADVDDFGEFCLDIPLFANYSHTLRAYVQDSFGATSPETVVSLVHDPAELLTDEAEITELAQGLHVESDKDPWEGELSALADGYEDTNARLRESKIWIDLGSLHDVVEIEIVFPDTAAHGNKEYATKYRVLTAPNADPMLPPQHGAPGWEQLFYVHPEGSLDAGNGGTDTFTLEAPVRARYVAFDLIENAKIDWGTFGQERIRVALIRVYGAPVPDHLVQAPTCAE